MPKASKDKARSVAKKLLEESKTRSAEQTANAKAKKSTGTEAEASKAESQQLSTNAKAKKTNRSEPDTSKVNPQQENAKAKAVKTTQNETGASAVSSGPSKVDEVAKKKDVDFGKKRKKSQKKLETAIEKKVKELKSDIKDAFSEEAKQYMRKSSKEDEANPGRDATVASQLQRLEAALKRKAEIEQKIAVEIGRLDEAYLELSREIAIALKGKLTDLEKVTALLNG